MIFFKSFTKKVNGHVSNNEALQKKIKTASAKGHIFSILLAIKTLFFFTPIYTGKSNKRNVVFKSLIFG